MYKMKYCKEITDKICESIKKLKGRVGACKEANIGYDAFCEWMKKRPEFAEAIKKAEAEMEVNGEQVAIQAIFRAMPTSWQAGAWWLERTKSGKYALRQKLEHSGDITVNFNKDDKAL